MIETSSLILYSYQLLRLALTRGVFLGGYGALIEQVVAEVGNRVVLGYDAHEPGALLEENNYDACMGYLNMLGITPIQFRDIEIRRPNGKIFG